MDGCSVAGETPVPKPSASGSARPRLLRTRCKRCVGLLVAPTDQAEPVGEQEVALQAGNSRVRARSRPITLRTAMVVLFPQARLVRPPRLGVRARHRAL